MSAGCRQAEIRWRGQNFSDLFFQNFRHRRCRGTSATRNPPSGQNFSAFFYYFFLFFSKISTSAMFRDVCRVSATRNPLSGAKFFRKFLFFIFSKISTSADIFGDICGVSVTRNPLSVAKFLFIFFFKNFDISDVWGRLRTVGDPKSAVGGKFFPKIIIFFSQTFRHQRCS